MKFKTYIFLLMTVTMLSACGKTESEEPTTEIQTDVVSSLHIEMNDEIEQKQEDFFKISEEYNQYLVDFSAYNTQLSPELFIQLYDKDGKEKYYVKANGDGTQYQAKGVSVGRNSQCMILSSKNDYYISLNQYRDVSVTQWANGSKDGLFYYDEELNEFHPNNLVNAVSLSDFAKYCDTDINKMNTIIKSSPYNFVETYEEQLETLIGYESDWNEWMHSSYMVKNGTVYEGMLSDDYINSVLEKQGALDEQNRQILLAEKESLGVVNVYVVVNEDGTVSFISQDGEEMTAIFAQTEETNDAAEQSEEESTTEESTSEEAGQDIEIVLPDKLIDENKTEYVFYSESENKDDNDNLYYEIVPINSLQNQLSYIKINYNETENKIDIFGVKYKDIQETIDSLDKFHLSLNDIKVNKDNEAYVKIGQKEQPVKIYLYDPKDAYVNKKIFALSENTSCIYIVVKENDFSAMANDINNYKELSFDEFEIVYEKFNTLVKPEESATNTESETIVDG